LTTITGDDGLERCPWGLSTPEYQAYHDLEWGRPVGDDRKVLEKLCLEGFQAGLSWLTILRKRENFRRVFASFEPGVVAAFDDRDVERLLADAGIVRHRGKVEAAIANARATVRLHEKGRSLAALLWAHAPADGASGERLPVKLGDLPSSTPDSKALSVELRSLGFRFVGPTTVYSAMQSLGVVNDHLAGCAFRSAVEEDRSRFVIPR
jgi:DNA-3-methyladenine glycosylase I